MCGISGSFNEVQAYNMYLDNLNRGYYSSGLFVINKDSYPITFKKEGKWDTIPTVFDSQHQLYWLYHSRGPTVETTKFIPNNNHPFFFGDWVVSHNGIISNFKELGEKYFPGFDFTGCTDSCIIPRILTIKQNIPQALEELKGTFAIWAYNIKDKKLYIARSASTLFYNSDGDFSSTFFKGSTPLPEGIVFEIKNLSGIQIVSSFLSSSPYFIL